MHSAKAARSASIQPHRWEVQLAAAEGGLLKSTRRDAHRVTRSTRASQGCSTEGSPVPGTLDRTASCACAAAGSVVPTATLLPPTLHYELNSIVKALAWSVPFGVAAYSVAPTVWSSAALLLVAMALYMAMLTSLQSVLQINAPDRIRGRVMSLSVSLYCLGYPLGALTAGWIADRVGVRIVLCAGAALFTMARVAAIVTARSRAART